MFFNMTYFMYNNNIQAKHNKTVAAHGDEFQARSVCGPKNIIEKADLDTRK